MGREATVYWLLPVAFILIAVLFSQHNGVRKRNAYLTERINSVEEQAQHTHHRLRQLMLVVKDLQDRGIGECPR